MNVTVRGLAFLVFAALLLSAWSLSALSADKLSFYTRLEKTRPKLLKRVRGQGVLEVHESDRMKLDIRSKAAVKGPRKASRELTPPKEPSEVEVKIIFVKKTPAGASPSQTNLRTMSLFVEGEKLMLRRPPSAQAYSGVVEFVLVRGKDLTPTEARYYQSGVLLATDRYGDDGKIVRRDLIEGKRTRVEMFYDDLGRVEQSNYLDEQGRIVLVNELLVPMGSMWGGYH